MPVAGRVAAAVNAWKTKLLDLTKRNRVLNFRSTKVLAVAIVDEQPAEVFRQLQLRRDAMRFKAAPETEAAGADGELATLLENEEENTALGADFVPYDPTGLDERHADGWLQTSSSPEALDRSLRSLEEQGRLSIEEQGVSTLFLALGMLTYTEPEAPGKRRRRRWPACWRVRPAPRCRCCAATPGTRHPTRRSLHPFPAAVRRDSRRADHDRRNRDEGSALVAR